jgi:hypothetical protein
MEGMLFLVPPWTPRSSGYDVHAHTVYVVICYMSITCICLLYVVICYMSVIGYMSVICLTVVRRGSGAPSTDGPGASSRHLQRQSRAGA